MRTGYRNLTGAVPVVTIRSEELLDRLERAPLWSGRNEDRRAFEAAHPYKAYGFGVACSMFKYGTGQDGALAVVSFDADGRIEVAASTIEMGTGTSTAVAVRVADHLGRSADQVILDSTGPLWEPLGLVTSGDPLKMSQQDQDAAAANPRWVPVISSRASASVGAPVTTHAVAEAAYALLRYSLWPVARAIWQAGDGLRRSEVDRRQAHREGHGTVVLRPAGGALSCLRPADRRHGSRFQSLAVGEGGIRHGKRYLEWRHRRPGVAARRGLAGARPPEGGFSAGVDRASKRDLCSDLRSGRGAFHRPDEWCDQGFARA